MIPFNEKARTLYLIRSVIYISAVLIVFSGVGAVLSCSAQEETSVRSEVSDFQKLEPWLKFLRERNARNYAITTANGVDEATNVEIGGIEQWITIRGEDRNNPVLLFLHGGPGDATNPWGYAAFRSWLKYFTVVQWDQRGSGRTLGKNRASASTVTPDRMAQDGIELSELLKKRFHKNKIVLVGHSWGSVLGFLMVKARPELFYAFVGTGQVAAEFERGLAVAYPLLLERASREGNSLALAELKEVGPPPYKDGKGFAVTHKWANLFEGADVFLASALGFALSAPGHTVADINDWFDGQGVSGDHLAPYFDELDRKLLGGELAVPVFVIQGAEDYTTPVSLARAYVDALHAPRKAFTTIEGAGHFAVFTKQDEFLKELRMRVLPLISPGAEQAEQPSPATHAAAESKAEPRDIVYTRPGQLIDVGGFRLNIYCMGSGSPTVVFDSGWGDWAPAWSKVQPEIAQFTRACSYDRAGTGFSDPGPMPRTSVRIAKELRTALHRAGIAGPYILVGSAFGGDNVRTFAELYMDEVAGLVLDDADSNDLEPAAMREAEHRNQARIPIDLRACRNLIAEHKPLPTQPARPGRPPQTCAQQFFFRGLPEAEWSPELNAKLLEIAQTKVAMYNAYASEMEQTAADEIYLQRHHRMLGSRPIRVLTSGNHAVGHLDRKPPDTPEHLQYEKETTAAQARWLGLSSNAKQIFAHNSSEYIQFDEPETVINAIREVYDQAEKPVVAGANKSKRAPGRVFRECRACPEMVVLPAGSFTMGSSAEEKSWAASHGSSMGSVADEAPQHQVSLPSFALGRYDVTRAEYAAFARETGYPAGDGCGRGRAILKWGKDPKLTWENPGQTQTDRDPVVCVSWQDARAYVAWLNHKAHRDGAAANGHYRLPSEAEWEYAARAGTTTKFYWGDDDAAAPDHAWFNVNSGCKKVEGLFCDGGQTQPVGTKPPNAFGLYDMAGNVWQWTEDCYDNSYAGVPADGRANETPSSDPKAKDDQGNCLRVDRGGSWMFPAWLLRPATRERNPENYRDAIMGFRVARTLP